MLAAVGHGGIKEGQIANRLAEEWRKDKEEKLTDEDALLKLDESTSQEVPSGHRNTSKSGIVVKGLNDLAVHFSHCCNPIPGDEIVGFVTRGRGISVHRTDCVNIVNLPESEKDRLIDAEWQRLPDSASQSYLTEIQIFAMDRIGLLADISKTIAEQELEIVSLGTRTNRNGIVTCVIKFRTKNTDDVQKVMARLRQIDGIRDVQRPKG